VANITEGTGSLNIVRAVAAMPTAGHGDHGGGVETEEQLAAVRAEGCTQMQGYLFSKPLPEAEWRGCCRSSSRAEPRPPTGLQLLTSGSRAGVTTRWGPLTITRVQLICCATHAR